MFIDRENDRIRKEMQLEPVLINALIQHAKFHEMVDRK